MWKNALCLLWMLASTLTAAHAMTPQRSVAGHTVSSAQWPKISIRVPDTATYLGADRWILGGYDDCEMHLFVDANAARQIQHLYWIQFEAYVPQKPKLSHTYDSPRHLTLGGFDFYVDTWVQDRSEQISADSDTDHEHALIERKGYLLPTDAMYVRLVHLPDAKKRHEVMIIYAEDLASTGFSAKDLGKQGREHVHWAEIEKGLIERAIQHVKIEP